MSDRPTVSVVVPLYNKRDTVARTVDSVLAQTFGDIELVLVDDGSTDGSPELVEGGYDDPRVRVVRQRNAGPGAARNTGVRIARADLIAFLDADDEWRPTFLATALEALRAHPLCAVFTASFLHGPNAADRWGELGLTEGVFRLTPDIATPELKTCAAAFSSSSAVYRRFVFEELGGFYDVERAAFGEDIFLWIKILLNYPIYRHAQALAHYHTEDSALGIRARKGRLPLEPMMESPDMVRAACPPELAATLELWLAQHAVTVAFMHLGRGHPDVARELLDRFPRMRDVDGYGKLRVRLAMPGVWNLARGLFRGPQSQTTG